MRSRLAAWLVTGPLGHLAAGVADWTALLGGLLLRRIRRRGGDDAAVRGDSLMPAWLPSVNRRLVNPVQRLWAPWLPPLALVVHRGRRSGIEHRTPVLAFRSGATLAIVLFYGSRTHWVRNVRAAGGGEVVQGGRRRPFSNPRIVRDASAPDVPRVARAFARRQPVLLADLG